MFSMGAGESIFLTGAAERLVHLGPSSDAVCQKVHGVELDGLAATLAKKALAATLDLEDCGPGIFNGNFFDQIPNGKIPLVQACIGNPPYIRYQSFSGGFRDAHQLLPNCEQVRVVNECSFLGEAQILQG